MNINKITIDDVVNCGVFFYNVEDNKVITRYQSWIICHNLFKKTKDYLIKEKKSFDDLSKETKNELCLYLSNYLGSWGMYRNSFLLWSNYKIHDEALRIIFEADNSLWDMNINNCNAEELNILINNLKDYYKEKRTNIYKEYNRLFNKNIKEEKEVSDTLISKILLGTLACTPAYDQFFLIGIKAFFKGEKLDSLNANSIKKICEEEDTKIILEKLKNKINKNYPDMKLLDSCFWQLGYIIKNQEEK